MEKIKILGAGLSGLTAAINLAKEGYKVKVFEKNSDCGERFDGDFQGLENWTSETDVLDDLKSMNIDANFYCKPFRKMSFYDPDMKKKDVVSNKPIFYLVRRGSSRDCFDMGLKKQAENAGVDIEFKKTVNESDADIIATGPKHVSGVVRGITFKTKSEKTAVVVLNDDISPKGYSYLLIEGGTGTIAVVVLKDIENADSYIKKAIRIFRGNIEFGMGDEKYFSGYGNFSLQDNYERDGNLIVGEAAGLLDFLLGFGMRYAVISGYLAARSIIEDKSYNKIIQERLGHQLKASLVNRFLFEKLGNRGYKRVLKRIKFRDPVNILNKQYNYSFTKKIIYPFSKIAMRK